MPKLTAAELQIFAQPDLPDLPGRREIGGEAVWSLSTAKPGNGVDQLRDGSVDTYWQSDGTQPHLINVQFHKKMAVVDVALYLDYKLDESYTPKMMRIRAGTTVHDLEEVHTLELEEPCGWVVVPLGAPKKDQKPAATVPGQPAPSTGRTAIRTHFLQVEILSMHQNGRDTHVRQVKVFGPRQASAHAGASATGGWQGARHGLRALPEFTTIEFSQFSCVR